MKDATVVTLSQVYRDARAMMVDIKEFSRSILERPLRRYQFEPLEAILDSIINIDGHEFLLIFPRQSGKNEAVAQLLTYLLNLFQRCGGNIVYGATGDGKGLGVERLESCLDNELNLGLWTVKSKPTRRLLGKAAVVFLSTHPLAAARGQTAHHLLVIDETQDQLASQIEAVFTPMRAASNATALYIGTVKTTTDFLWQKKLELEREQQSDGIQRVFLVSAGQVIAENPAYKRFLDVQVRRHGRHHPIVASEYFLEPIDATGGLFNPRRQALMRGDHTRQVGPRPGRICVATLDVAGEDEAATDPIARLARPGRDYTVATVFEVVYPPPGHYAPGPTYRAVDVFVDHGSKHFQDHPARPALIHRLHAWLEHWNVAHVVADASGVGQGLVSWLKDAFGDHRVTGFDFSGSGKKARLGSAFLSLVETGRFKYWSDAGSGPTTDPVGAAPPHSVLGTACACPPDSLCAVGSGPTAGDVSDLSDAAGSDGLSDVTAECSSSPTEALAFGDSANRIRKARVGGLSDAAWFWAQVRACAYEIPPDGRFDRDLRWEVPPSHRTDTPQGPQPTHDDRLLSAALVAELDRLLQTGALVLGTAQSAIIPSRDPLQELGY